MRLQIALDFECLQTTPFENVRRVNEYLRKNFFFLFFSPSLLIPFSPKPDYGTLFTMEACLGFTTASVVPKKTWFSSPISGYTAVVSMSSKPPQCPVKSRLALQIQYDGRNYHGWERKPDVRTVQSTLETALSDVFGHLIDVHASSRTDAGAHAIGQVAHFDTDRPPTSHT